MICKGKITHNLETTIVIGDRIRWINGLGIECTGTVELDDLRIHLVVKLDNDEAERRLDLDSIEKPEIFF